MTNIRNLTYIRRNNPFGLENTLVIGICVGTEGYVTDATSQSSIISDVQKTVHEYLSITDGYAKNYVDYAKIGIRCRIRKIKSLKQF